jgi:hypothetical protein
MGMHPVLTALMFGGIGGTLFWRLGPEDPGRIAAELQANYDRQAAGWEAKDIDGIFSGVDPKAVYTSRNGAQQSIDDSKEAVGGILSHGDDFRENWKMAGINLDGDRATVILHFHNEYTMQNCTWNSVRGIREPFEEDGTCVDVWQRELGQWREKSSTSKTFHLRRNGVPFTPA